LYTNIFWLFYLVCFIYFYDVIFTYDSFQATRNNITGVSYSNRGGLGFVSPNNIGLFLLIGAYLSLINKRNFVSILYVFCSFLSFIHTDSRANIVLAILFFLLILFRNSTYKLQGFVYISLFCLCVIAIFASMGLLDYSHRLDMILSHRLHYINIIFQPSLFGTTGLAGLDNTMMSILNRGGLFAYCIYIVVIIKVFRCDLNSKYLIITFVIFGLAENIVNQYFFIAPLLWLKYFQVFFNRRNKVSRS